MQTGTLAHPPPVFGGFGAVSKAVRRPKLKVKHLHRIPGFRMRIALLSGHFT
jgi:hypothetical protein